ncbi:MAG: hypothetical protein D6767_08870 [Candidatus Hydrogenedentota bacterium]|nr:MAG: hypothetical protein D6767_08870 [Candidatus Hydrogenedentota bacterium]
MNYVRFLLGKYLPQQNSFWKLSILTSISILLFTTPVFSNVYKLNNGSFLRGDLLKQDTSSITLRLREIRMPAWLYNAAMYKYQLDRQKMQKIRKIPVRGIIALKGDPILKPEVTIPKVQIQKTLKSETMWLMRVHEKNTERVDVFSFDERNLTYYDLGASSANPLAPDTPYKDILVSIPVKQIEALYALRNGKKEKIYPEPWYSFLTKPTLQDWDPRAGLIYSPFVPVGAIRQIDFGAIGGGLYGSINLPIRKAFSFMRRWHLRARTGLYLGYNQFSIETQYANSNIQLFPIMWIISIYYDFRKINGFYFSPSFKWNQGIIFSTVHKELKPEWRSKLKSGSPIIDGAYNGYASQLSLGLEVKHRSQRRLAYFLDLGYLVHAEDLSGTFFTMNLGVAWHFASSAPRAVVMPVLPTKPGVTFVPLELSGKTTSLSNSGYELGKSTAEPG